MAEKTSPSHRLRRTTPSSATSLETDRPRDIGASTAQRLRDAKIAFTCRRVPKADMTHLVYDRSPEAGDLVLARVIRKRQHPRIELPTGRKALLYAGDEIIVCYGNRYATDQFEAEVPQDLGPCHLVASGGVAATMISRNRAVRSATEIEPIGLVADSEHKVMNLRSFAVTTDVTSVRRPSCVAVVGSAMNAGKTTSAAHLVHGLKSSGLRVGAAKITGTGSGGDFWKLTDAGADVVLDFTDAGHASTYKVAVPELCRIASALIEELTDRGAEAIVLEIADGIFQQETNPLIRSAAMRRLVDGYLLAVTDPLAAAAGAHWMSENEIPLLALCGTLTRSPLAVREAASATSLPVLTLSDLRDAQLSRTLVGQTTSTVKAPGFAVNA